MLSRPAQITCCVWLTVIIIRSRCTRGKLSSRTRHVDAQRHCAPRRNWNKISQNISRRYATWSRWISSNIYISQGSVGTQLWCGGIFRPNSRFVANVSRTAIVKEFYKKFELMLTRRAKDYSSPSSQTVSLSPAFSSQFILGFCAAAEDRKN